MWGAAMQSLAGDTELMRPKISLDPNPVNTSHTFPWGWSHRRWNEEQSGTQLAQSSSRKATGIRAKDLAYRPGFEAN